VDPFERIASAVEVYYRERTVEAWRRIGDFVARALVRPLR
jgi:hypothetical protein